MGAVITITTTIMAVAVTMDITTIMGEVDITMGEVTRIMGVGVGITISTTSSIMATTSTIMATTTVVGVEATDGTRAVSRGASDFLAVDIVELRRQRMMHMHQKINLYASDVIWKYHHKYSFSLWMGGFCLLALFDFDRLQYDQFYAIER